jgi:redox-sensitive bicupin YhaK (pirin superfamily)
MTYLSGQGHPSPWERSLDNGIKDLQEQAMDRTRKIRKVFRGTPTIEGAGVRLKRGFGYYEVPLFDPFLMLDDFHSNRPQDYAKGFPWHPHRGIETITYMRYGAVEHGDSMGNKGVISSGDVQWMTAGSGIIHEEMPRGGADGLMWGFQLWANMPASCKMMDPRYRDVKNSQIPEVILENNVKIKVVCGKIGGVQGPVTDIVIDPQYLDITIPFSSRFTYPVQAGHTVFAYVMEGGGYFDEGRDPFTIEAEGTDYSDSDRTRHIGPENVVLFGDGDGITISSEGESVRFLLISGKPIGEPVAWYGPIVMNTQEELRVAFEEYGNGRFVK